MIALLLLAQAPDAATLMATARARVAPSRCVYDRAATDITVCGLRHADRYRVPFLVHDADDPRYETVAAERARLLHRTTPIQDLSPFLVGGGAVGVGVTFGSDGSTRAAGLRKLAP